MTVWRFRNLRARLRVMFHSTTGDSGLAGPVRPSDVRLQRLANVPAFYYGTSANNFFDYFAAGFPILVNFPGWLADTIMDHQCGIAVQPDDPISFADALEYAETNCAGLKAMGHLATALAKSEFDCELLAAKFVT